MAIKKRAAPSSLVSDRPKRIRKPSALALEAAANKAAEERWKEDKRMSREQMAEERAARATQKVKAVHEPRTATSTLPVKTKTAKAKVAKPAKKTKTTKTAKKTKKIKKTKTPAQPSRAETPESMVKDVQVYKPPLEGRAIKRSIVASKNPIPLPSSASTSRSPILMPAPPTTPPKSPIDELSELESPVYSVHTESEASASAEESEESYEPDQPPPAKWSVQSTPKPSTPPWHALQQGLTRQNASYSPLLDALQSGPDISCGPYEEPQMQQAKESAILGRNETKLPSHEHQFDTPMDLDPVVVSPIKAFGEGDVEGTGGAEDDEVHQIISTNTSAAVAPTSVSVKQPLFIKETLPLPQQPQTSPTSASGILWWRRHLRDITRHFPQSDQPMDADSLHAYSQWRSRLTLLSEPLVRPQSQELGDSLRQRRNNLSSAALPRPQSAYASPSLPLSGQSPKRFAFPLTLRRRSAVELSEAPFPAMAAKFADAPAVQSATPIIRQSPGRPSAFLRHLPTPGLPDDKSPAPDSSSPEITPLASSDSLFPPTPPTISGSAPDPTKSTQDKEDSLFSPKALAPPLEALCHRPRPMLPVPLALPAPVMPSYMEDVGIATSCQFVGCPRCYYVACQCPCHKNPNNSFAFVGREEPEDWVDFDTALARMIMDIEAIVDDASTADSSPIEPSYKADVEMVDGEFGCGPRYGVRQVSPFGTREQTL